MISGRFLLDTLTSSNASRGGWRAVFSLMKAASIGVTLLAASAVFGSNDTRFLDARVDVTWNNVRLRQGLGRLADAVDFDVFVDRRVDSEQRVKLTLRQTPLRDALTEATRASGLGYAVAGPVVYVGPRDSAAAVEALIARRDRLPKWLRWRAALEWPRLSEPRRIVGRRMPDVGARLANPDDIPHDLWSAGALPAMRRADQLTLLLVGFDLTWEIDPDDRRAWRVVPIGADALGRASDRVSEPLGDRPQERSRSPRGDELRFTLRVAGQPLDAVLRQIASRTGRRLEIDPAVAEAAERPVDFDVRLVTVDELVTAAAQAAGLRAEVTADRIAVRP